MTASSLSNIFIGSLIDAMPFYFSWSCLLLSAAAWMQVALLCDHAPANALRAMKTAVRKCCARTPWCVTATVDWNVLIVRHLPAPPEYVVEVLASWLNRQAVWLDGSYASWHAPHDGPCSMHCADWCHDFPVLQTLYSKSR